MDDVLLSESVSTKFRSASLLWWGVSLTLLIIWVVSLMDKITLGVFIADEPFLHAMGLVGKPAAIGLLLSSFLVAYGLTTFVIGFVIDRLGVRRVLFWSMVVSGVFEFLQGYAGNLNVMILLRVLLGISQACLIPASIVMTAKWFPMKERARAQSVWLNGINLGPVAGILLVTFFIAHAGWQMAFKIVGILQLIVTIPMIWYLTAETPADHPRISAAELKYIETEKAKDLTGESGFPKIKQRSLRQVFSDNKVWLVFLAWILDTMIFFTIAGWFVKYMHDIRHLSLSSAGSFTSFSFLIGVVGMLIAGQLSDRWLKRRAPISTLGYALAAVCLFFATRAATPLGAALGLALTMTFKNMASTTTTTMMHNSTASMNLGTVNAIQVGPSNLLAAFGPWFFGVLIGLSGGFADGFNGIVVLFAISALSCLFLWIQKQ